MGNLYLIFKIIHLISLISFMAGVLYLPRLFVYHSMQESPESESSKTFEIMEKKLMKLIINPSLVATLLSGLILSHYYFFSSGFSGNFWIIGKFLLFLGLCVFHMFCSIYRKKFLSSTKFKSTKFFRIFNEIPAVIMVFMVILAVLKP